jgi:hypothetical protein
MRDYKELDSKEGRSNLGIELISSAGGYKTHFFVSEADVIRALSLEPDDPDWEKIGWDTAQPADLEACERLRQKRESVVRGLDTA